MNPRLVCCFVALAAWAQEKPVAHFHHVHLNSTDPAAAIEFYTHRFDCEKSSYKGQDAVWAQKSWILFNKVSTPAPFEVVSAIWHIGWGAEDMPATYRKQLDMGTHFQTPITDISGLANSPNFFYAYVDGPEHELIELNTSRNHIFGHLHLFSEDPVAAGEWYVNNFGAVSRGHTASARFYKGFQVAPSAAVQMDNVSILIFPDGARAARLFRSCGRIARDFETSKNRAIDHIAFSVDDLARPRSGSARTGSRWIARAFWRGRIRSGLSWSSRCPSNAKAGR